MINYSGFTSIEAQNYKSFKKLNLNIEYKKHPKHIIAIYGENGSGKSNIVTLFNYLRDSISTLTNHFKYMNIQAKLSQQDDLKNIEGIKAKDLLKVLPLFGRNLQMIFNDSHMIGAKGPMIIKYNFQINNHNGYYRLKFNKNKLCEETLSFTKNKNRTKMFEILKTKDGYKKQINKNVFSEEARQMINNYLSRFWGSHTFLACILAINLEENNIINENNISKNFIIALQFLMHISFKNDNNSNNRESSGQYNKYRNLLNKLISGKIKYNKNNINIIRNTKDALNEFFVPLYSDIISLNYNIEKSNNNTIVYRLFELKKIDNNKVKIPFNMESNGTHQLLYLFPLILNAISGEIVIIDEIDNGIHDLLMNRLMESINEDIKGQLIFTTHDTSLMKELKPSNLYIIQVDVFGKKSIQSISSLSNIKINENNNVQKMYLNGFFSGIPYSDDVYFDDIINDLASKNIREK